MCKMLSKLILTKADGPRKVLITHSYCYHNAKKYLGVNLLLKFPMKAIPSESPLLYLVCAPTTPQPRPSNTVPSLPTIKLKHTESVQELIRTAELVFHQCVNVEHTMLFLMSLKKKWHLPVRAQSAPEILTYIRCHQMIFRSYVLSGCWRDAPCTLSGPCTSGGQCGEWKPSEPGHSKGSPFA